MDLKSKAIGSLVCGIIAVVSVFTGYGTILGLILGIVGIVISVNINKQLDAMGDISGDPILKETRSLAKAGMICSIVGVVIAGIGVLCVACVLGTVGASLGAAACSVA